MMTLIKAVGYAKGLWGYYAAITVSSILVALTWMATPFLLGRATDLMVVAVQGGQADVIGALWLAVGLFGFDIANTLIRNYGGYLGDVMSAKLKLQLSTHYYKHLLALPQSYYDSELTGTIINRLNRAITEVSSFINMFANNLFQTVLTIIFVLIVICFYSWELALLIMFMYPTFLWITARTSRTWQRLQDGKNLETDIASGRFAEVIAQMRVVKSYVQEKLEYRRFLKRYQNTVNITQVQSAYWHRMDVLRGLVIAAIFFAIFAFIFVKTVERQFTIGEMVLLVTFISSLREPLFNMSYIIDSFQRAITGSKDFVTAMEVVPDIADNKGAKALRVPQGAISYQQVDFSYTKTTKVLTDITFDIAAGSKVALVGESGEGKTTIANLLMRLYEPTRGEVLIDGVAITAVTQASLRHHVATVFQDPALFSGTIRQNIVYARPNATEEEVVAAAKAANVHSFIERLEKGYASEIGERGIKLSGGQKQRIAIARAILKDAPILILDEATSSLDSRSEVLVQEALERLMQKRTTLIIAHRLSTIAHVDRIITLKGGRIHEIGSPAKLATSGGIYAQLLELQTRMTDGAKKKLKSFDIQA